MTLPPPSSYPPGIPVGRLAPSPTGVLHLGNLSTFGLAWLQARAAGGRLLLRIEDLDRPRTLPGCEAEQRSHLTALGITWDNADDDMVRQSARDGRYLEALRALAADGWIYPCTCSRRQLQSVSSAPHGAQPVYPGTCRPRRPTPQAFVADSPVAWRMYAPETQSVCDGFAGEVALDAQADGGDFVVRRRDGLVGYQLATAVDDGDAGVTDVVRGRDLLTSTTRQWAIQRALGLGTPRPWHAPLVIEQGGHRLAKRDGALGWPALQAAGWTVPALWGAMAVLWGFDVHPTPRPLSALLAVWKPAALRADTIAIDPAAFAHPDAFARWAAAAPRTGAAGDSPAAGVTRSCPDRAKTSSPS